MVENGLFENTTSLKNSAVPETFTRESEETTPVATVNLVKKEIQTTSANFSHQWIPGTDQLPSINPTTKEVVPSKEKQPIVHKGNNRYLVRRKIKLNLIPNITFLGKRPEDISPLGFNYTRYYHVNNSQPIEITAPKTKWISGNWKFKSYMNDYFIPFQQENAATFPRKTIYLKRGTTGIAGQMSGMCDVLLLSILHNRTFHCTFIEWS